MPSREKRTYRRLPAARAGLTTSFGPRHSAEENLNVKILWGALPPDDRYYGPSHHATEDIAMFPGALPRI